MKTQKEYADEFREWLERGPGEPMYGGIIKAAASTVKRRIAKRLETPNLFPHIEHEDRADMEKANQAWRQGDKMVKRGRARVEAIKGILDANAGLQITDEDLQPQ